VRAKCNQRLHVRRAARPGCRHRHTRRQPRRFFPPAAGEKIQQQRSTMQGSRFRNNGAPELLLPALVGVRGGQLALFPERDHVRAINKVIVEHAGDTVGELMPFAARRHR
jgi:hypothetical protein